MWYDRGSDLIKAVSQSIHQPANQEGNQIYFAPLGVFVKPQTFHLNKGRAVLVLYPVQAMLCSQAGHFHSITPSPYRGASVQLEDSRLLLKSQLRQTHMNNRTVGLQS